MSEATLAIMEVPPHQLDLMDASKFPERPDVLDTIRKQPVGGPARWRHTGRRFFKKLAESPSLAEMVWTGLRMGLSVRLLAHRCGVSPNTLSEARRLMEERGELEAVRRRIDRRLDEFCEEALEYALEGVRSGRTHPGQISIPALAAYDKRAQRDLGVVPGTELVVGEVIEANARAAWAAVRRARLAAIESESIAEGAQVLDVTETVKTCLATDTSLATAQAVRQVTEGDRQVVPAESDAKVGGGVPGRPAVAATDASRPENFEVKDPS